MKLNDNITRNSILTILRAIKISNDLRIDCYDNKMPFCLEVYTFNNIEPLSMLLSTSEFTKIVDWTKVDLTFTIWDIMERFNVDITFDKSTRTWTITDR